MRPAILNPLFAAASGLKGIGPRNEKLLAALLGSGGDNGGGSVRVVDLLFHMPTGLIDRSLRSTIDTLPREGVATVEVIVERHRPPPNRASRVPYRVECYDDTGSLALVFFHAFGDYLRKALPEGERRFVSGRVERYGGLPQIAHPDYIVTPEEFPHLPKIEPVYPLTAGLSSKVLGKAMRLALEKAPALPEWQEPTWLQRRGWPDFRAALQHIHAPATAEHTMLDGAARQRLAYDELLANQLALALLRRGLKQAAGRSLATKGELRRKIADALPYRLTQSQSDALSQILRDMAAPERMIRLLQGDVGSGKTAVALMALAEAVEAGTQGALMVPTELLARQHGQTLRPLAAMAGIRVETLTGREKGPTREAILERLRSGETQIVVGTHAIFQEGVAFRDLGLAVVDEQHRFGVHQRLALQAKAGSGADLLVMTATPIPRTLALTLYGDMDVSRITEKPAGRQPVDTRVVKAERFSEVVDGLERALAGGQRAYWVCPLVAENEATDRAAAEQRYEALKARFGARAGLVHGRMKGADKDAAMQRFQSGDIGILVSTTVIEVGVDVPEATIMVIENAERFGLAQLHQLRGRVGRGKGRSTCILIYQGNPGETALARLRILRETEDGFRIAEEDLKLRGAGELLGTRQSGVPAFRLAEPMVHGELLPAARDDAQLALSRDPALKSPRGQALRCLLYLFERDVAVRLLSAG